MVEFLLLVAIVEEVQIKTYTTDKLLNMKFKLITIITLINLGYKKLYQ